MSHKDQHQTDIKMLEQQLADLSPNPLSKDLLSRMEQAMESWETHLPLEEKIIPFAPTKQNIQNKKKSSFPIWSSAAAVALIAAVGAVFMSSPNNSGSDSSSDLASTNLPDSFQIAQTPTLQDEPTPIPQHFSHQLKNASNEGITYAGNNKPYKVIRIEYTKDVEHTDQNGKTTITKEPVIDHILVPIQAH